MKERIRRVRVLFQELGFHVSPGEELQDSYTGEVEDSQGFQAGFIIDRERKYLEIAFTFSFSILLEEFLRNKLEEMFNLCGDFGCYIQIYKDEDDIVFTVFSKLYYAGLNYFSLKETLRDFRYAVTELQEILDIQDTLSEE